MEEKEIYTKFFNLSGKGTLTVLAINKWCKIAYTNMDLEGLKFDMRLRAGEEEIMKEIAEFCSLTEVVTLLKKCPDLKKMSQNYKFSTKDQYDFTLRNYGRKFCIDDILEDC